MRESRQRLGPPTRDYGASIGRALALFVGIVSLGCAYVFTENRGTRVVAGIFLVAIGVAVFLAKPITVEHIIRMRHRMGRTE
jgi:hypothetical protein